MTNPKRHLIKAAGGAYTRSACGLVNPRFSTQDPARVTCRACTRTLYMADAEIRKQRRRSNP